MAGEPNLECPLCDWTHPSEMAKYAFSHVQLSITEISRESAVRAAQRNQAKKNDELVLDNHLRGHSPQDWLRVLDKYENQIKNCCGTRQIKLDL